MSGTEYRVTWKRVDLKPKRKRYCSLAAAERFITLLGPEPWLALGKSPDEPFCCRIPSIECDCDGRSVKEQSDMDRAEMPPLEWVRLAQREVGPWSPLPGGRDGGRG